MTEQAGWYPDPGNPRITRFWTGSAWSAERFWDGSAWVERAEWAAPAGVASTSQPRAAWTGSPAWAGSQAATPAKTPTTGRVKNQMLLVLTGAGLIIIGSLLPWASQNNGLTTTTVDGSSAGGGQISIIFGLLIAGLAAMYLTGSIGKRAIMAILVFGALTFAVCVANMVNVSDVINKEKGQSSDLLGTGAGTSQGIGLVVLLAGSGLVVVVGVLALVAARRRVAA